jgi:hypothetical protein
MMPPLSIRTVGPDKSFLVVRIRTTFISHPTISAYDFFVQMKSIFHSALLPGRLLKQIDLAGGGMVAGTCH